MNPLRFISRLLLLAVFCGVLFLGWFLWGKLEGEKPVISGDIPAYLNTSQEVVFHVSDAKTGIRSIRIAIEQNGKETVLKDDHYPLAGEPGSTVVHTADISVKPDIKKLGISDGKAVFHVEARDNSWRQWFHGNKSVIDKEIKIDTKPPEITVLSKVHNLTQGGAGLVIYRLSKPCPANGVMVGDQFYPGQNGYFSDPNTYMAFIALNYRQGPGTEMYVKATDDAGNSVRAGFLNHIKGRVFKSDTINVSDGFLNQKMPEFKVDIPPGSQNPMLDKFLKVNREVRDENYRRIVSAVTSSDNKLYWEGTFVRLPDSAPRAGFADHRTYMYKGKEIDQEDHLGVDLASVQHAPIPAANSGRVVFTEMLGIYGNTVLIDHGFGLFSMYSHMNSFNVKPGQMVSKNDILGYTDTTGMAAGDHLHYSMLVHQTFVNPIEWWDPKWIKNNITDKIDEIKSTISTPTK